MNDLISFFKKTLGDFTRIWNSKEERFNYDFQVIAFEDQPFEQAVTFTTAGVSKYPLRDAENSEFFQELIFISRDEYADDKVPKILMDLADDILKSGTLLFRGDVIHLNEMLFEWPHITALYATSPAYFPENFHIYKESPDKEIIMVWLIPITKEEADFALSHGWEEFDDLLAKVDPDLTDFSRGSIV